MSATEVTSPLSQADVDSKKAEVESLEAEVKKLKEDRLAEEDTLKASAVDVKLLSARQLKHRGVKNTSDMRKSINRIARPGMLEAYANEWAGSETLR